METGATETEVPVPTSKRGKGCLILFGLVLVFSAAILALCAYLIVHADPSVPSFGVKSATMNSPKITSSRLVAELDIVFNVSNNNEWHKASCSTVSISLINSNQSTLASTSLEPFSQKKASNVAYKEAQLNIDVPFSNGTTVDFEIVLSSDVKFKSILNSKHKPLNVVCNPLSMSHNPGSSNWVLVHGLTCN